MDVFSPALEIRNAGSLGDCISPTPRNWEELECPVDVFSPVPLNKRELENLGDCITPTPRNWKSWNVRGMFLAHVNIYSS